VEILFSEPLQQLVAGYGGRYNNNPGNSGVSGGGGAPTGGQNVGAAGGSGVVIVSY
jgi:hypothetical protein